MRANYSIARRSRNQTMRRSSSEDQVVSNEHEYGNKTPAGRSKTIFPALAAVNGKPSARCAAIDGLGRGKDLAITTGRLNTLQNDPLRCWRPDWDPTLNWKRPK